MTSPRIHWVNHASFILEHDKLRLITDPWLCGRAFNDGWALISPTVFRTEDFASITHIWFSHEHPDHFSPPVLQRIPAEIRRNITVLFQETLDRKVVSYCAALGFMVQELPDHRWVQLSPGMRVMCGKVPYFDSWLLIDAAGTRILNANDCVVDGEGIAEEIARRTGPADILLTQFSYANWIGNPGDAGERREAAREKLERVRIQASAFAAKQIIPFASMVHFCHEENAYLNDEMNTVRKAHDFIANELEAAPVVLYPGDTWTVGCAHDNAASLARYDHDYQEAGSSLVRSEPVSVEEMVPLARAYIQRIRSRNSAWMMGAMSLPPLRYFDSVVIDLSDLGTRVTFDMTRGLNTAAAGEHVIDATMGSQSLAYIFAHDWGYETLEVNGRFRATARGHRRLVKMFFLGPLNNTGRFMRFRMFFDLRFLRRALGKLRQLARA